MPQVMILNEHMLTNAGLYHLANNAQSLNREDWSDEENSQFSTNNVAFQQNALSECKSGTLVTVDAILPHCRQGAADALINPVFEYVRDMRGFPGDEFGKMLAIEVIHKLAMYHVDPASAIVLKNESWEIRNELGARPWVLVLDQLLRKDRLQDISLPDRTELLGFLSGSQDALLTADILKLLVLADKMDWGILKTFSDYLAKHEAILSPEFAALRLLFVQACVTTARSQHELGSNNIPTENLIRWTNNLSINLDTELNRVMDDCNNLERAAAEDQHDRQGSNIMQLYETCEYLAKLVSICRRMQIDISDLTLKVLETAHRLLQRSVHLDQDRLVALAKVNTKVTIPELNILISNLKERKRKATQSKDHIYNALPAHMR